MCAKMLNGGFFPKEIALALMVEGWVERSELHGHDEHHEHGERRRKRRPV